MGMQGGIFEKESALPIGGADSFNYVIARAVGRVGGVHPPYRDPARSNLRLSG
jgi:hypothetical protein